MKTWIMEVYPGRAHWYKPIEELTECYNSREEAEADARVIAKYRPDYYIEILRI